jgi:hypothetical protein
MKYPEKIYVFSLRFEDGEMHCLGYVDEQKAHDALNHYYSEYADKEEVGVDELDNRDYIIGYYNGENRYKPESGVLWYMVDKTK